MLQTPRHPRTSVPAPRNPRAPVPGSSSAITKSLVIVAFLTAALALGRLANQYINTGTSGVQGLTSRRVRAPTGHKVTQRARSLPLDEEPASRAEPGSSASPMLAGALLGAAGIVLGFATKMTSVPAPLTPQAVKPPMEALPDQSTQLRMMLLSSNGRIPPQAPSMRRSDSDASLSDIQNALEKGASAFDDAVAHSSDAARVQLQGALDNVATESKSATAKVLSSGEATVVQVQTAAAEYLNSLETAVTTVSRSVDAAVARIAPTSREPLGQTERVRMLLMEKRPTVDDTAHEQARQAMGAAEAMSAETAARVSKDFNDFKRAVAQTTTAFEKQASAQGQHVLDNINDSMAQVELSASTTVAAVGKAAPVDDSSVRSLLLEEKMSIGGMAMKQASVALQQGANGMHAAAARVVTASELTAAKVGEDCQDFQRAVVETKKGFEEKFAAEGQVVMANIQDSMKQVEEGLEKAQPVVAAAMSEAQPVVAAAGGVAAGVAIAAVTSLASSIARPAPSKPLTPRTAAASARPAPAAGARPKVITAPPQQPQVVKRPTPVARQVVAVVQSAPASVGMAKATGAATPLPKPHASHPIASRPSLFPVHGMVPVRAAAQMQKPKNQKQDLREFLLNAKPPSGRFA